MQGLQLLRDLAPPVRLGPLLGRELEHFLNLVERLGVKALEHVRQRVDILQAGFERLGRLAQEGAHRTERLAGRAVLAKLERRQQDGAERVRARPFPRRDGLVREESGLE